VQGVTPAYGDLSRQCVMERRWALQPFWLRRG
jgi:hypothetical protein